MGSFFGNIWSDLKFNAGSALDGINPRYNFHIGEESSDLVYVNSRYKSVAVHVAKQIAMATLKQELNSALPKFRKHIENRKNKDVKKKLDARYAILKQLENVNSDSWGKIIAEGNKVVVAQDKYGNAVPEALIVYYNSDVAHTVEERTFKNGILEKKAYNTKTIWHIDLSPVVSMNSSKNIVQTKVQGRDYTRKELVSGGDLTFSVQGKIVSDTPGIYPENEVKKFLKIMQYGGILDINFMMLGTIGVKKIIVTDFSLGAIEMKNVQPYSFNCVAVEPDEDIQIVKDTINIVNDKIAKSPMNAWYNMVLDNKLAEIIADSVTSTVTGAALQGASMGLDKLAPNI